MSDRPPRRRRRQVGYAGILLEPLEVPDVHTLDREFSPILLARAADEKRMQSQAVRDVADRVQALFEHYDIQPLDWKHLALALAFDHVEGFETKRGGRAKRIETQWYLFMLYDFVTTKLASKPDGYTVSAICSGLPNDPDFQKNFPELRRAGKARLQNLVSKAVELGAPLGFQERQAGSPMFIKYGKPKKAHD